MECFSSVFWGRIGEKKFWLHLFIMSAWFWLEHNTKRCLKNLFSSPRLEHRTIIAPLVQLHGQVAARREGTPPPTPVCLPASATPASPLWPFVVPSLTPRSKLQWSQRLLLRAVSGKHALWQRWGAARKGGRISEPQIIFIPSSTSPRWRASFANPAICKTVKGPMVKRNSPGPWLEKFKTSQFLANFAALDLTGDSTLAPQPAYRISRGS